MLDFLLNILPPGNNSALWSTLKSSGLYLLFLLGLATFVSVLTALSQFHEIFHREVIQQKILKEVGGFDIDADPSPAGQAFAKQWALVRNWESYWRRYDMLALLLYLFLLAFVLYCLIINHNSVLYLGEILSSVVLLLVLIMAGLLVRYWAMRENRRKFSAELKTLTEMQKVYKRSPSLPLADLSRN